MKTVCYVEQGDHVKCCNCGSLMLVPYGQSECPVCRECTLAWADINPNRMESSVDNFDKQGIEWEWADDLMPTD